MRRIAIGDVHGCSKALRTVIETIDPQPDDEIVFLGDYVDRGPDSRNVVDQIIELQSQCNVVALRGNHEIMLLAVALHGMNESVWLNNGGRATVTSYGGSLGRIPAEHLEFFQQLDPFYETDTTIFVHAGYHHLKAMSEQDDASIYWNHLLPPLPPPHKSGKRVVVGHTPQPSGNILNGGHVVCIDTYCFGTGYLTALDVSNGEIIQADRQGHARHGTVLARRLHEWTSSAIHFCRRQLARSKARSSEPAGRLDLAGKTSDK